MLDYKHLKYVLLYTVSIYFAIVSISSKAPRSPCRRRDDLLACAHCLPGSSIDLRVMAGPVCYPKGPHPVAFTDRVLARAQSPNVVVVRECVYVLGGRLSGKVFCRSDLLTSQLWRHALSRSHHSPNDQKSLPPSSSCALYNPVPSGRGLPCFLVHDFFP